MFKNKDMHRILYEIVIVIITGILVGVVVYGYGKLKDKYAFKELF